MPGSLSQQHFDMMSSIAPYSEPDEIYGFCDTQGAFHGFEGQEGRKFVMAMKALEEKVLAQVEKSLVPMRHDIQQIKQKSETSSWMFRNIVAEQKDLSSRIDELNAEAFESRSDVIAQLEELSREAFESRFDLITRCDEICQETLESRMDCMASLEELEKRIDTVIPMAKSEQDMIASSPELEQLEEQRKTINGLVAKFEDKAKVSNLLAGLRHAVDAAQKEDAVKAELPAKAELPQQDEATAKTVSACDLDLSDNSSSSAQKESSHLGCWSHSSSEYLGAVPYSAKIGLADFSGTTAMTAFSKKSNLVAPPSFNVHRPRPLARMTSCQSMPLLAPLF